MPRGRSCICPKTTLDTAFQAIHPLRPVCSHSLPLLTLPRTAIVNERGLGFIANARRSITLSNRERIQAIGHPNGCNRRFFSIPSKNSSDSMHVGNYARSVRHDLGFITKAWCLCIEAKAQGVAIADIERELFSGDSSGRHWDRLKNRQIPDENDFRGATNAAVAANWLSPDLAEILLGSFSAKRSLNPGLGPRDGWGELAAQQQCLAFGFETNSQELIDHCAAWGKWIDGPDEKSPEFENWIKEKEVGWKIADEEIDQENIDLIVERAAIQLFEIGVSNPVEALKVSLGRLKKNWPSIQAEINQDMRESKNS